MADETPSIAGIRVPRFVYGTAWKEGGTQWLTELALQKGFRGIDTANQRRHYVEAAVGSAVANCIARGIASRDELFLQTKFTFRDGQDHRLPYDPNAPIPVQVRQSFESSLEHLQVKTIDSYLLHGPTQREGLASDDWQAWQAMEELHDGSRVRLIGVSNFTLGQLQELCGAARVRPAFIQNRCYANRRWDRQIRHFCAANGVTYQGFSLLTANRLVAAHPEIQRLAQRYGRTESQIIFRFALDAGMIPLTGTTDPAHMEDDLKVFEFRLQPDEINRIENLVATQ